MVELINLRAQRRRHRLRRRAGAYHYGKRRKAEMTVRNIERRLRFPLKTLAAHIAYHTDDCAEDVVAEAETFADRIFIGPVAARESFGHNQRQRRFAKPKRAAILLRAIADRQPR